MQTKFRSKIAVTVDEDMRDMFRLGLIDKQTMHKFDELSAASDKNASHSPPPASPDMPQGCAR